MSTKDPILEGIMTQVGEWGPYQFRQHCLHLLTSFLAGVHMLSLSFVAAVPDHRCYIPELDDGNSSLKDLSEYIPKDKDGNWETCLKKNLHNQTQDCGGEYYFDPTFYPSSRVIDFGLVCDKRWMGALLQTIYMFGVLLGGVGCGTLADKFGRKPLLYISGILQLVFGVASAFMPNYYLYATCQLFYGMFGSGGAYVTGFVLSMELVGQSKRTLCGTLFSFTFAVGVMMDAFWAWLIPNAQLLQIVLASHSLLLLGHWWLTDESIRWLWGKGRKEEASKIASKAVEINGKYFVKHDPTNTQPQEVKKSEEVKQDVEAQSDASSISSGTTGDILKDDGKAGLMDVFRMPNLRMRLFIMAYAWFANSLVYYGLAFNIGTLPGNPFLMSFLNGLAEVPGYIINITLLDRTGRRSLESLLCTLGGIACITIAFIPHDTLVIVLAMVAKIAIASSFAIVYNYAAELFPTVCRNSVVGITTMAARSAGMLAPEIILLSALWKSLPTLIFGSIAVISGFLTLFLPETLNKEMPQTIEEGEVFGTGDSGFHTLFRWCKRRRLSHASRNRLR